MCYGDTPDWYRNEKTIEEFGYATDLITEEAVRHGGSNEPLRGHKATLFFGKMTSWRESLSAAI